MRHLISIFVLALAGVLQAQDLKVVHLPPGGIAPFDIGWTGWNGSNRQSYPNPIAEGYDGIRFVGSGRNETHILPRAFRTGKVLPDGSLERLEVTTGNSTIFIGKGCGIVQFESLTIHTGPTKGVHVGDVWKGEELEPSRLVFRDVALVTDPPPPGRPHTSVWGILTYNTDIDFLDVYIDCFYTAEHALYAHGFNKYGISWRKVTVAASGAEQLKVATRPEEVAFVPNAQILVRDCNFGNWYQEHSWRGGGGIVLQGSGASQIIIERCRFRGGDLGRGSCLMIDCGGGVRDGVARFYNATNGQADGKGPANGDVIIRRCGLMAGPGPQSWKEIMRVGTIAPPGQDPIVASSLFIEGSGFFGERRLVRVSGVGPVIVRNCNSPRLVEAAGGMGVPVEHPAPLTVDKSPLWSIAQGWPRQ